MSAVLVGVLKQGEMKRLFKHLDMEMCNYDPISFEDIKPSDAIALFRLPNHKYECHLVTSLQKWFNTGNRTLPDTRYTVTYADSIRILPEKEGLADHLDDSNVVKKRRSRPRSPPPPPP